MARQLVRTISPGDTVKLKTNEPPFMVVYHVDKASQKVSCFWFDDLLKQYTYNKEELEVISSKIEFSSNQVAQWMQFLFERSGMLLQKHAVSEIIKLFDKSFLIIKGSGKSIKPDVLKQFNCLVNAEWSFSKQMWSKRK